MDTNIASITKITGPRIEGDSRAVLDVGLSEIVSLRVGCWTPPVHVVFADDGTPHAA